MKIKLYTPHANQTLIHNSINNEPYKYYVLNIGRQWGKSLLGVNQALYWLFNIPNIKVGWVSPVYKQCKKVFNDIDLAFSDSQFVFKDRNRTDLYYRSHKNSIIQFYSSENYDTIRGETFDFLLCDETSMQQEQAWNEVLRATVLVRGRKVIFLSTPKGKNWFFGLHSLDGVNPQYKSFTMTSYDNPLIKRNEIDDARLTLPDHIFRQEYLAEFIDGGSNLFGEVRYEDNISGTKFFGGLDVARAEDYTVLTIYNENGQMVFIERWRHDSWANIVRVVATIIDKYNARTFVEINSIGDPIFEMLQKIIKTPSNLEPFATTSKSKQDIIEQLVIANQSREVTFLPVEWLRKEFLVFTYEYSPKTRSIKYAAPSGFHDDGIMSAAIGYEAYKKLNGASLFIG